MVRKFINNPLKYFTKEVFPKICAIVVLSKGKSVINLDLPKSYLPKKCE